MLVSGRNTAAASYWDLIALDIGFLRCSTGVHEYQTRWAIVACGKHNAARERGGFVSVTVFGSVSPPGFAEKHGTGGWHGFPSRT